MRVVYAGYRSWAYDIVHALSKTNNKLYSIVGVLTTDTPEAPYSSLPLEVFSINPTDLSSAKNKRLLKKLKPDVFLFYGWSWKIPEEIFSKFPCLILHTSPLPKYRGGSPLQHQIMRGETMSAISMFQATSGIDEGPIYGQAAFSLDGTIDDIFKKIVKVGIRETKHVLENFIRALGGPYPTAFIRGKDGKKLFIKTVEIEK
jgi:methionyl-tRNA formyltransferase